MSKLDDLPDKFYKGTTLIRYINYNKGKLMNRNVFITFILLSLALFLFNDSTEVVFGAEYLPEILYREQAIEQDGTIYLPVIMNGRNTTPPTATPIPTSPPTATRPPANTPTPTATPRPAGPTQVCGAINGAQTWTTAGSPYVVTCDVIVSAGSSLTVMAGVIVKFRSSTSLFVDDTLRVLGTEGNPVYFTSYRDDLVGGDTNNDGSATVPATLDWGYVRFSNTSSDDNSLIEHLMIRYSGNVFGSRYGAIRLDNASPVLRKITFTNNYINSVEIPSSQWASDTWDNTDVVYFIRGDVTIQPGQSLIITAGIKLKFNGSTSLLVNGTLQVKGTVDAPVYFTSVLDDLIGGDTNNDGSASTPATLDWGYVRFGNTSSDDESLVEYLEIRYSGNVFGSRFGAIRLDNASPTLRKITFANNFINGVEIPASQWESDTWDNTDVVYFIRGDVTIQTGQTLTITAGMKVKFNGSTSLFVEDTLRVLGTENNPVYFTSYRDDLIGGDTNNDGSTTPATLDWGYIHFSNTSNDNASIIEHLQIRYSGNVFGSRYGAIRLDNASPTLRKITFANNYINSVEIPPSQWESDTWDNIDVVYFIRGDVTIQPGQSLTIVAGTKVKFNGSTSLIVNGTLQIKGTADNPIYFTSYRDDLVGGDTNNDGSSTPSVLDWGYVLFGSSSSNSSIVEYLKIRYSGNVFGSRYGAIRLDGKSLTINNSTFTNNYRGVEALANAAPTIRNSNFSGQQSFAVYNATPAVTIDARNNWWGSPSGPKHASNSSGQGETVSDGVNFADWSSTEN